MKIKKLIRIVAKSEFMDLDIVMMDSKATGYVKRIRKLHTSYLDSLKVNKEVLGKWRTGSSNGQRAVFREKKIQKVLPEGVNTSIKIEMSEVGQILD